MEKFNKGLGSKTQLKADDENENEKDIINPVIGI